MLKLRSRIVLFALAVALAGAIFSAVHRAQAPAALLRTPRQVTLVYVGADDCAPCRAWQRDAGPAFRASPEFARIVYEEVKSPKLFDLLDDAYWPLELRRYRERLDVKAGAPLWLLIADDAIVEKAFGLGQWQAIVLPKLRSLLRKMG